MDLIHTLLDFPNIHLYFYAVTWIISIIVYKKYFDTALKYFPVLLAYILLNETLGNIISLYEDYSFISLKKYREYNVIIYNIYRYIFFSYFFFVYWSVCLKKESKNIIKYLGFTFFGICFINIFLQDLLMETQLYTQVSGNIFLIVIILVYLKELLPRSTPYPHTNNLLFWVSLGLLVFYVSYLPLTFIRLSSNYFNFNPMDIRRVHILIVLLMYTCFIIGLLKIKRVRANSLD